MKKYFSNLFSSKKKNTKEESISEGTNPTNIEKQKSSSINNTIKNQGKSADSNSQKLPLAPQNQDVKDVFNGIKYVNSDNDANNNSNNSSSSSNSYNNNYLKDYVENEQDSAQPSGLAKAAKNVNLKFNAPQILQKRENFNRQQSARSFKMNESALSYMQQSVLTKNIANINDFDDMQIEQIGKVFEEVVNSERKPPCKPKLNLELREKESKRIILVSPEIEEEISEYPMTLENEELQKQAQKQKKERNEDESFINNYASMPSPPRSSNQTHKDLNDLLEAKNSNNYGDCMLDESISIRSDSSFHTQDFSIGDQEPIEEESEGEDQAPEQKYPRKIFYGGGCAVMGSSQQDTIDRQKSSKNSSRDSENSDNNTNSKPEQNNKDLTSYFLEGLSLKLKQQKEASKLDEIKAANNAVGSDDKFEEMDIELHNAIDGNHESESIMEVQLKSLNLSPNRKRVVAQKESQQQPQYSSRIKTDYSEGSSNYTPILFQKRKHDQLYLGLNNNNNNNNSDSIPLDSVRNYDSNRNTHNSFELTLKKGKKIFQCRDAYKNIIVPQVVTAEPIKSAVNLQNYTSNSNKPPIPVSSNSSKSSTSLLSAIQITGSNNSNNNNNNFNFKLSNIFDSTSSGNKKSTLAETCANVVSFTKAAQHIHHFQYQKQVTKSIIILFQYSRDPFIHY